MRMVACCASHAAYDFSSPGSLAEQGSPDHRGCSSWIAAAEGISGAGAVAALSDAEFEQKQARPTLNSCGPRYRSAGRGFSCVCLFLESLGTVQKENEDRADVVPSGHDGLTLALSGSLDHCHRCISTKFLHYFLLRRKCVRRSALSRMLYRYRSLPPNAQSLSVACPRWSSEVGGGNRWRRKRDFRNSPRRSEVLFFRQLATTTTTDCSLLLRHALIAPCCFRQRAALILMLAAARASRS